MLPSFNAMCVTKELIEEYAYLFSNAFKYLSKLKNLTISSNYRKTRYIEKLTRKLGTQHYAIVLSASIKAEKYR